MTSKPESDENTLSPKIEEAYEKHRLVAYNHVKRAQELIERFRMTPYVDKKGEWIGPYIRFGKLEVKVTSLMHDLLKCASIPEIFEDEAPRVYH